MNNSQIARRMQSVRPSPTAAISDQVRVLEAAGKQVYQPGRRGTGFCYPAHISYAGIEAIVHHQISILPFPAPQRSRRPCAKFARDNQLRYRPEEIIAGSGAKQLIFNAFLATLDAGQQGDYSRALLGLLPGYGLSGRRRTGDCAPAMNNTAGS